jgi:hypothetical protein
MVRGLWIVKLPTFVLAGLTAVGIGYRVYDTHYLSPDVKGFLHVCVDPTATTDDQKSYLRKAQAHIHTAKDADTVEKVEQAERLFGSATQMIRGEHKERQLRLISNLAAGRTTSQAEQSAIEKQDEADTGAREALAKGALKASEELYTEVRATMGLPPAKFYNLNSPKVNE